MKRAWPLLAAFEVLFAEGICRLRLLQPVNGGGCGMFGVRLPYDKRFPILAMGGFAMLGCLLCSVAIVRWAWRSFGLLPGFLCRCPALSCGG